MKPKLVRGVTPFWEYPCGCEASALEIRHCATHAAAPALLEALEQSLRWLDVADRFGYPKDWQRGETHLEAGKKARTAIAQAKGESR